MVVQQEVRRGDGEPADPFLASLRAGPLLCDGAMGTQLYARGVAPESCFESAEICQSLLVEAVHRDYILAGAQVIETNTYGANAVKLAAHGLADQVHVINTRGVRWPSALARARERLSLSQVPWVHLGPVSSLWQDDVCRRRGHFL